MSRFLTILLMAFSLSSFADVEVPAEIPVEKCEDLKVELDSFARDLTNIGAAQGASDETLQESFSWILVEVTMSLADEPADCKYIVKFVKRKHQEFLDAATETAQE